jgi:hypothetical protein
MEEHINQFMKQISHLQNCEMEKDVEIDEQKRKNLQEEKILIKCKKKF